MIDDQRPINIFTDERTYVFPKGRNLLVSPVRWGKTTLLAKAARQLTATDNAICLFVSPNLNNLQEDWVDKHAALRLVDQLDLECCYLKQSYHTWTPDLLSDTPLKRIYSTNKHAKWLDELKKHLEAVLVIRDKITKHLVFLVDEVHGIASDAEANKRLGECIDLMNELGTVIASTATPHRVIGREEWTKHINIEYPEGVLKPHETPLAELSNHSIQQLRSQEKIPQELIDLIDKHRQPGWNICPVVGQRLISWHVWFIKEMSQIYPQAEFLRISNGEYSLMQDGVEVSLKRLFNRPITSVQQAVDAVTDHLFSDRDDLQLFVVGHAQIEEGQTHGNFSGTRFPTFQIIIPPLHPWDDKFAQWVRIEHRKAAAFDITPTMITGIDWWTDYITSTNYMAKYSKALNDQIPFNDPLPKLDQLKQSALAHGVFKPRTPKDISHLELCHDIFELTFEGAQSLIDSEKNKRGGHKFRKLHEAAKSLASEQGAPFDDNCRILYHTDNLEAKFFYTNEKPREAIHIVRHDHPDRAWVISYKTPFNPDEHQKIHPRTKEPYVAEQILPPVSEAS